MWIDIWQLEFNNSFLEDLWVQYTVLSLDHVSLPWHCPSCRVIIVLQVIPQLFPCLAFSVAMNALQLLFPGVHSSLFARYHIVVVILLLHSGILGHRISHANEIVTADGSEDNIGGYLWLELDHTQQTGISVGQDTKMRSCRLFCNSSFYSCISYSCDQTGGQKAEIQSHAGQ